MDISVYKFESNFKSIKKAYNSTNTEIREQFLMLLDPTTSKETILEITKQLPAISEKLSENDLTNDIIKLIVDNFNENHSELLISIILCISVNECYAKELCKYGIIQVILKIIDEEKDDLNLSNLFRILGNCFVGLDKDYCNDCCEFLSRDCLGKIILKNNCYETYYSWMKCLYGYASSENATLKGIELVISGIIDFIDYYKINCLNEDIQDIIILIFWIFLICIDNEHNFKLNIIPILENDFFKGKEYYFSGDVCNELKIAFICLCGNLLANYNNNIFGLNCYDAYSLYLHNTNLCSSAIWLLERLFTNSSEYAEEFNLMDLSPFINNYNTQSFSEKNETSYLFIHLFEKVNNKMNFFMKYFELFISFMYLVPDVVNETLFCINILFNYHCGNKEEKEQFINFLASNGMESVIEELRSNQNINQELLCFYSKV